MQSIVNKNTHNGTEQKYRGTKYMRSAQKGRIEMKDIKIHLVFLDISPVNKATTDASSLFIFKEFSMTNITNSNNYSNSGIST